MINRDKTLQTLDLTELLKRMIKFSLNGVLKGVKKHINFIPGNNVTVDVTDNAAADRVDVTISAVVPAPGIADGDYGDVTVSGGGTVINIDPQAVGDAELRNSAGNSVIGRSVSSAGSPADIAAASPGDVLRVAGSPPVLGFGAIPESSVTNLITDLAGKVPTTRTISTTAPITGGGDLSANRTLAFDSSALLDNNARVKVLKNSVGVATRREVNFIEGTNITLTITDDVPNDQVDIVIDAAGGGGSGLTHPQVMSRALILC